MNIDKEDILMRTSTWTNIGKDVTACKDMEQVLQMSGLDYTVEKRPIFTYPDIEDDGTRMVIPNRFITTRRQDGHTYDVVSDKFEIIQNRDAFDFVKYMGDELLFEKAGETQSGMVFVIGKLPEVDILGDRFTPHVIFRNGFSGKVKITAAICPLRIVCQNQFNFAFKNTANTVQIRHVGNAEAKLEEAKEVLRLSADYMAELNTMAEHFAAMRLDKARMERITDYLFPMPTEDMNPFKRKSLEDARAKFISAHDAEDNRNFRGTAWGMVNAYTDYLTHKEPAGKREDRFEGKFVNTTFKVSMNPILQAIETVA